MHALVIEDQFLIATLIEDELADLGYTSCDIVERQEDAIAAALRQRPDLITADDRLTSGSGLEAVKAICMNMVIPVVFIVGDPNTMTPPIPFCSVIGKPFGGNRLREAILVAIELAASHIPIPAE